MIQRINQFIKATLMGGLVVILPSILLLNILWWLNELMKDTTRPLVNVFVDNIGLSELLSQVIVISIVIGICFFLGVVIRNRVGAFLIQGAEKQILERIPGYSMIKELVGYFLASDKKSAFSSPALVQPWGTDVWLTGFIVEEINDTYSTVFIPTAPNPLPVALFVICLSQKYVLLITVETEMFKTIVACGAGSRELLADELQQDEQSSQS